MKYKRIILWILVIIWMFTILSFSSESANVSDNKSRSIVEIIRPILEKLNITINTDKLNHYIRKTAHIFNYFVLTLLIISALGVRFRFLIAYLASTIFSSIDEFLQTFINGRGGRVSDVIIDNIGILLALLIIYLIERMSYFKPDN